jgi:hypothetical protein
MVPLVFQNWSGFMSKECFIQLSQPGKFHELLSSVRSATPTRVWSGRWSHFFVRLASASLFNKSKYYVNWRNAIGSSALRTSAWECSALREIAAMTSRGWDQPSQCGAWSRCLAARQGEHLQGSLVPVPPPLTPEGGKPPSWYLYGKLYASFLHMY